MATIRIPPSSSHSIERDSSRYGVLKPILYIIEGMMYGVIASIRYFLMCFKTSHGINHRIAIIVACLHAVSLWHSPLLADLSSTLALFIEVPNSAVAKDAWAELACYPQGNLYPLISGRI